MVWVLSKTQDLPTAEERERTKVVPYALYLGSTGCYDVYRTWSVPCHESVKGYKSDPGIFSITKVVKEFVVKGYADANFDTNPDYSE